MPRKSTSETESFTGSELLDALKAGRFANQIVGLVQQSGEKDHVSFSLTNGRTWIDIPVSLIEKAERPEDSPANVRHPVMRITLKAAHTEEGKVFAGLFRSATENLIKQLKSMHNRPAPPPTALSRHTGPGYPSPTGSWQCVGDTYPCGCYPGGETMYCCDDWVPGTTIGPAYAGGMIW